MKTFLLFLALPLSILTAYTHLIFGEELTLDRLFGSPNLSGPSPRGLKVSPDGARVTYLEGKKTDVHQLDLWKFDVTTKARKILVDSQEVMGKEILSEEEKSRRERQRIQDHGIIEYYWDAEGKAIVFPLGGDIYYKPLNGLVRRLTNTKEFETDIKVSPKGHYVSFIRDLNIFVIDLASGNETQLTSDGKSPISNGVAEFVAQEEMNRFSGYWWSPDDTHIAFTRVDESPVQILTRYEINADGSVTTVTQRYPRAGTSNVLIQLGVINVKSGKVNWIDLGPDKDIYLARVNWLWDSKHLSFQRQTRDQKQIDLIFADIETGTQKLILSETSKSWTDLNDDLVFLRNSERFIWTSEKDGFRHIYLYSLNGDLIRQITSGNWEVHKVNAVDEKRGLVYFEGFADTPLENHLYAASLEGGAQRKITNEPGWHTAETPAIGDLVQEGGRVFIDSYSSNDVPPRTVLKDLDGKVVNVILDNPLDKTHPYYPYLSERATREFGTMKAEDGTVLHYSLLKPPHFESSKKYPVIVFVYGGPTGQEVTNVWQLNFNEYLARHGYIIFQLDNRGTPNRGTSFQTPLYHNLGDIEVRDQLRGVDFLKTLAFVDANRIGVYGWSYGGYMTALLLFKGGGVFRAGFCGAPVTDWRLYDTHYTERYMGDPRQVDEAYTRASVFPYVQGLKSSLLLMHGMADDNVFFDNSVKLIAELEKREIIFELMTYPGERHGIYGQEQGVHRWKTAFDFFERKLKN
jgi:dipeptidyl-peptidase 4